MSDSEIVPSGAREETRAKIPTDLLKSTSGVFDNLLRHVPALTPHLGPILTVLLILALATLTCVSLAGSEKSLPLICVDALAVVTMIIFVFLNWLHEVK